tara:strand:- start:1707 stop:1844 length:138 start_codon:yes stop_codon:yes gene_type:complete
MTNRTKLFIVLALTGIARVAIIGVPVVAIWMGVSEESKLEEVRTK